MGNRAVEVRGGVVGLASGLLLVSYLHHPPPASTSLHHPDIHSEYVKYLSGKDTITAYLAYPERRGPGTGGVVIHGISGMSYPLRPAGGELGRQGFGAIGPGLLSRNGGTPASSGGARPLSSAV